MKNIDRTVIWKFQGAILVIGYFYSGSGLYVVCALEYLEQKSFMNLSLSLLLSNQWMLK